MSEQANEVLLIQKKAELKYYKDVMKNSWIPWAYLLGIIIATGLAFLAIFFFVFWAKILTFVCSGFVFLGCFIGMMFYYVKRFRAPSAITKLQVQIAQLESGENSNSEANVKKEIQNADLLLKYKQLLDSGAITQEEFDKKKSEIL